MMPCISDEARITQFGGCGIVSSIFVGTDYLYTATRYIVTYGEAVIEITGTARLAIALVDHIGNGTARGEVIIVHPGADRK